MGPAKTDYARLAEWTTTGSYVSPMKALDNDMCTWKYFKKHVQTHCHARNAFPWQNDYIHVSKKVSK